MITGVRNKALIAVLWRSQLRIGEALALRPIDYQGDRLRVLHGKGDRARVVGVDVETQRLVNEWLEVRPESKYLFCTQKGGEIDTSYVRHLFKRLQAKTGIAKRCHPHGMRHTGSAELASEGVPIIHISTQLGHANVATTDAYIRHLCPNDVIRIIRKREW
jgi:integrase/recombinase XerD